MPVEEEINRWLHEPPQTRRLDAEGLPLDAEAVARGLGYGPHADRPLPRHLAQAIEDSLAQARALLDPQMVWAPTLAALADSDDGSPAHRASSGGWDGGDRDGGHGDGGHDDYRMLICSGPRPGRLAVGGIVGAQLRGATAVAAFVVTIGPRLETASRRLMGQGQTLEGYVLDAIGSVAVEACADVLESVLADAVARWGWWITNRFSPGYCTWPTSDQQALFALLPDRPAGVTLNASSLMTPIKSVSGIIGLGESVEHRPYPCDFCAMENCHQRLVESRW